MSDRDREGRGKNVSSFLARPVNKRDVERGFGPSPPVHSEWEARLRVSRPTNDPVSGVSEWRHAAPNHARPTGPAASSPLMGLGGLCNSSCAVRPSCCPSSDGARRTILRTPSSPHQSTCARTLSRQVSVISIRIASLIHHIRLVFPGKSGYGWQRFSHSKCLHDCLASLRS